MSPRIGLVVAVLVAAGALEVAGRVWLPTQAHAPGFRGLGDHARLVATLEGNAWRIDDDTWDIPNRYDPDLGWTNAPGVWPHPEGFPETVNAQGWHDTRPYAQEAAPGVLRVGCFGDSFTYGSDARDGEAWPNQLHDRLAPRGMEALNLGVPGYGHDQISLLADRELGRWDLDVVVYGYTGADESRNLMTVYGWPKPRFEPVNDGALTLTHVPVPPLAELLAAYRARPRALDLLWIAREAFAPRPDPEAVDALAADLVRRFVATARAQGVPVLLVAVPGSGGEPGDIAGPTAPFEAVCADAIAPCLDPTPALRAAAARGVPIPGPLSHLSAEAYAILAEEIDAALQAHGLLPPAAPADLVPAGAPTPEPAP
jgi:hypothetical protein